VSTIIHTRVYPEPHIDRREILRYAGVRDGGEELYPLVDGLLSELLPKLTYRVCYSVFPITLQGASVDLGFAKVNSHSLSRCLDGCDRIVLFAATVGLAVDRATLRYGAISESRALLTEAIGNERIEALCDTFCRDMRERYGTDGYTLCPRFSPGYGDLPIELQRDIFSTLMPSSKIGLTLNSSLLMSPAKSVTAVVGMRRG